MQKAAGQAQELFADSSAGLLEDMGVSRPVVEELLGLVADFDDAYSREKRRRNLVNFADLGTWPSSCSPEDGQSQRPGRW